jgi:hypothetical protein
MRLGFIAALKRCATQRRTPWQFFSGKFAMKKAQLVAAPFLISIYLFYQVRGVNWDMVAKFIFTGGLVS